MTLTDLAVRDALLLIVSAQQAQIRALLAITVGASPRPRSVAALAAQVDRLEQSVHKAIAAIQETV